MVDSSRSGERRTKPREAQPEDKAFKRWSWGMFLYQTSLEYQNSLEGAGRRMTGENVKVS